MMSLRWKTPARARRPRRAFVLPKRRLLRAAVPAAHRAGGRVLRAGALAGRGRAARGAHAARRARARTARAGRAGRAAAASVQGVVLIVRELAVVVPVELGEARIELGGVLRLVSRDVAVMVLVEALEVAARRAPGSGTLAAARAVAAHAAARIGVAVGARLAVGAGRGAAWRPRGHLSRRSRAGLPRARAGVAATAAALRQYDVV